MKLSYAITVCNELDEITRLLDFLVKSKRDVDEIVVLLDKTKADKRIETLLAGYVHSGKIKLESDYFNNHFADWKNKLSSFCTGDYIFQIDADEIPNEYLTESLPEILETNPDAEVILVPRVNTVEGLTPAHIKKWHWDVNEKGWVNWPDYQWRIYKNCPDIKWKNHVHERLAGFKVHGMLPAIEDLSLYHPKTIDRQERQNSYYDSL